MVTNGGPVGVGKVPTLIVIVTAGALLLSAAKAIAQERPEATQRKVLTRILPIYPELARKTGMRGVVRVVAFVAPNGKVTSTQVVGGSPLLAKAAVDAIEKWKFAAASGETQELIELRFSPE